MHILVVEDEPRLANLIAQALNEEGHVAEIAVDGEEGYDLAAGGAYDVIVLDLMLPKMPGMEVARALRAEKVATPILMLTARGEIADRVEGLDAGADDYLVKPFALEELFARIRALGRRKIDPRDPTKIEAAGLTLDLQSREVVLDGSAIDLTPKEFALLEHLMRNPGAVQSRERIADRVWGLASDVTLNVVDLYIHYLRNKLSAGGGKNLIRTVRGVGYVLKGAA